MMQRAKRGRYAPGGLEKAIASGEIIAWMRREWRRRGRIDWNAKRLAARRNRRW